jgi:hypothetical protein
MSTPVSVESSVVEDNEDLRSRQDAETEVDESNLEQETEERIDNAEVVIDIPENEETEQNENRNDENEAKDDENDNKETTV